MARKWICVSALGLLGLAGCPSDPTNTPDGGAVDMATPGPVKVGARASKSATIAISDDDTLVAVCNVDDRSVSFFTTSNNTLRAKVAVGGEPSSVVLHPDGKTAFVAVRADATVVKISGIDTANPMVGTPIPVGSEPTGLALSPTGAKLFVAEYAEGKIGVIDTRTLVRTDFVASIRNPRALLVTNNNDVNDDDETLVAPEFFGSPQPGLEGKDNGRTGIVRMFSIKDGGAAPTTTLTPLTKAEVGIAASLNNGASPNQLAAVATTKGRFYIPSISASPEGPPQFDSNVAPVIYVIDAGTKTEVRGGNGTTNMSALVNALPTPRFFMADTVDLDFVPGTSIAYAVSRGAEIVQRIDYSGAAPTLGSTMNKQIDLIGNAANLCQNPNGIAVAATQQRAYVNCWGNQRMAVLDLGAQNILTTVDSAPLTPSAVTRGRHFFFTGRGRWSGNGTAANPPTENGAAWSSCGSCHPDGLSDNMTWIFAAGPRQTTALDGSFSHTTGAPMQKQRIFNWTGIIDEMHDFEGNTRGTSGGLGAITTAAAGQCGNLAMETRQATAAAALGTPTATSLLGTAGNCVTDWNDINEYGKTVRPPRGLRFLDAASVARGAVLFGAGATGGGCVKCHGGQGWTVSRRHYDPSTSAVVTTVTATAYVRPAVLNMFNDFGAGSVQIAAQPAASDNLGVPVPPLQTACNIRKVGSFGVPGDATATTALEVRAGTFTNGAVTSNRAQGAGGYNVPSLYGMSLGSPYLHHGQAKTLVELFSDAKWVTHTQAGSANFLTSATAAQDRQDLVNFILSIDGTTQEQMVPTGFADGCAP